MRGPPPEREGPEISEELKKKFRMALEGRLSVHKCSTCPQSRSFVPVVEFLIDMMMHATERMDIASQRMEEFIEVFNQLEEKEMRARFGEEKGDGR